MTKDYTEINRFAVDKFIEEYKETIELKAHYKRMSDVNFDKFMDYRNECMKLKQEIEDLKIQKHYWECEYDELKNETENTDVYIEQLEQENQQLKKEKEEINNDCLRLVKEYNSIRKENYKLKIKINK